MQISGLERSHASFTIQTPTMSKVQPFLSQLQQMPVTSLSPLPQSQPHCRSQQPFQHKEMRRQQSPFSSLTHTPCPTFSFSTNKRSCNKCLSAHKQTQLHHTSLLSTLSIHSTIDTNFSLRHFHFIYNFVTFAVAVQSAINIFCLPLAPHPTKLPKSL